MPPGEWLCSTVMDADVSSVADGGTHSIVTYLVPDFTHMTISDGQELIDGLLVSTKKNDFACICDAIKQNKSEVENKNQILFCGICYLRIWRKPHGDWAIGSKDAGS